MANGVQRRYLQKFDTFHQLLDTQKLIGTKFGMLVRTNENTTSWVQRGCGMGRLIDFKSSDLHSIALERVKLRSVVDHDGVC